MKTKYLLIGLFFFITGSAWTACNPDLVKAVKNKKYVRAKILIREGANTSCTIDNTGKTLLHLASESNDIKILRLILREKSPFIPTDRFLLSLPVAGLIAGIFLILSLLFGILYSHKLAGPIYRIEKTILQLMNGSRNFQVKLRKKDEFKKLADTVNKLIAYLNEHSQEMTQIKELLDKCEDNQTISEIKTIVNRHLEELEIE